VPRSSHYEARPREYEKDDLLKEEWNGTWRLQAPNGASCHISYGTTVPLTGDADCLSLPLVAKFQQVGVVEGRFEFYGYNVGGNLTVMKAFEPGSFDHLVDSKGGWRLDRLDAEPVYIDALRGHEQFSPFVHDVWACGDTCCCPL
jgi:hypothetical protein